MDDDFTALLIIIFIFLIALVVMVGVGRFIDSVICQAKTENMGFNHQYTFWGGCKIEVNPGQWIPLDSYYFKQE